MNVIARLELDVVHDVGQVGGSADAERHVVVGIADDLKLEMVLFDIIVGRDGDLLLGDSVVG